MKRIPWITLIIAVSFAGLTARAVQQHGERQQESVKATLASNQLVVSVAHPQRSDQGSDLLLPADVQAFQETPIYARTNGYVKRWLTGMGTPVKTGQLLAEIDTPELDQERFQAEAMEAQTIAARDLAQKTDTRWQGMLKAHAVSQQEADQFNAQLLVREADVRAAQANVQRLRALQAFKQVKAPFDGLVTARSIDVGTLVTAGNSQPLFRVAQAHILRVYVQVPQSSAPAVKLGQAVGLEIPEFPGRHFEGKITSTAGAIDPATRTLNTEIQIRNPNNEILPGTFGRIRMALPATANALTVPATALIFRGQGAQVATVDEQNRVHLNTVRLGRDMGVSLEVLEGLTVDDRVVLNPGDSLIGGESVDVVEQREMAVSDRK